MKTLRALASEIAKREGKKSQARIGDIREILRVQVDIIVEQMLNDEDENAIGILSRDALKKYESAKKKLEKKK